MRETRTQANNSGGGGAPCGAPGSTPRPDLKQREVRPSEAEAAHAPEEGGATRDPGQETAGARETPARERGGS